MGRELNLSCVFMADLSRTNGAKRGKKTPSTQIFRSIFINSIMRGIVFCCCCVIVFNRNGNKKIIILIAESIKPSIHSFLLYRNRKLKVLVKRIIGFLFSHLLLNGARL